MIEYNETLLFFNYTFSTTVSNVYKHVIIPIYTRKIIILFLLRKVFALYFI